MANVTGIEVSGTAYDLEDTTARNTASSASSAATQASGDVSALQTTVNNISDSVDSISDDLQTVQDNVGDLADLETTVKTDVVSAINEIVTKVQSRPIVTVKTRTSSNSESKLTPSDVINAGFALPIGSYLVTVYRNTSSSLTYFIGWVWSTQTFDDCNFNKLSGEGTSLIVSGDELVYNGGDTDSNIEVTWIFQPIGDSHCDN